MDLFSLDSYHFNLPQDLIAQEPAAQREGSRLMVVERESQKIWEMPFRDLKQFLGPDDGLILNNTKVIPARLIGKRESGGQAEAFLLRAKEECLWEAMLKPARKLPIGSKIFFEHGLQGCVEGVLENGCRLIRFSGPGSFQELLHKVGKIPLPQYITREPDPDQDGHRYQTVYAKKEGAVAAPTAGLHFSKDMLSSLKKKGVEIDYLTLHVGAGTFRPVRSEDIREHEMHGEVYEVDQATARRLNEAKGRRICVGTTCCRTLETIASEAGVLQAGSSESKIFIYPGYRFRYVQHLLTNFHLPGSTLLMLVSAFGGYELMMEAYHKAVKDRFRFFSYGDAMLIL